MPADTTTDNRFSHLEIDTDEPAAPAPAAPAAEDNRFSRIELDDEPAAAAAPAAEAEPAPAAQPTAAPLAPAAALQAAVQAAVNSAGVPSRPSYTSAAQRERIRARWTERDRLAAQLQAMNRELGVEDSPRAPTVQPAAPRHETTARDLVILAEHNEIAGSVAFWTFSGSVGLAAFEAAWAAAEIEEELKPKVIGADVALARACKDATGRIGRGIWTFPRRLAEGRGWTVIEEVEVDGRKTHRHLLTATLNADKSAVQIEAINAIPAEVEYYTLKISENFSKLRADLSATDMGSWLARTVVPRLEGVCLRESGGVYYLPAHSTQKFTKVIELARSLHSGSIYAIPAMKGEDSARAAIDALAREVEETVKEIRAAIADHDQDGTLCDKPLHGKFANNRQKQIAEARAKVVRYENLLGLSMATTRRELDILHTEIENRRPSGRFPNLEID